MNEAEALVAGWALLAALVGIAAALMTRRRK